MNYVLDDKGNRIEGLSKEEILAVIQQAIDNGNLTGIDTDSAFVSKLKCCVAGETHYMGFVTQAKYNELKANGQLQNKAIYFIIDDTTAEEFENDIVTLQKEVEQLSNMPMAEVTEDENGVLRKGNGTIPQRVALWESDTPLTAGTTATFTESLKVGDIVEIYYGIDVFMTNPKCFRFKYVKNGTVNTMHSSVGAQMSTTYMRNWDCGFNITANSIAIGYGKMLWFAIPASDGGTITLNTCSDHSDHKVYGVYKVIG